MGFKKIYLLGVDGTNTHLANKNYFSEKRHFYNETPEDMKGQENTYLLCDPDDAKRHDNKILTLLAEYASKKGAHIYNATRGGVLDIFERVSFDDLT